MAPQQRCVRPLQRFLAEKKFSGKESLYKTLFSEMEQPSLYARTGGNPFFTEEVVQSLIESGALVGTRGSYRLVKPIDRFQVPMTVQALLAARIDRLGEREKFVLQSAAVIG